MSIIKTKEEFYTIFLFMKMANSIIRKKQVNEEEVPASDQYLKEIRDLL
ncbi:hypothetical protein [Peribacillus butanolivorans]